MSNEDGKTTKTASAFRLEYSIRITINATAESVWMRLTNAKDFASWNSTVTSIEGPIEKGQKLTIVVPVAPNRKFTPTVVEFEPNKRMVWADGMAPMFRGERTYTLTQHNDGTTEFAMSELFRGIMLPMIKGSLPDFTPVFETYAADLKRACEASA
jgi:hypothetical protein